MITVETAMMTKILYEDTDIIVVHKPAGIAVQTAGIGQADVVSELKNYLAGAGRAKSAGSRMKAGNGGSRADVRSKQPPYLGVIHRLDQPVEGVLVFAKNREAAAALSREISEDDFCKEYLAVVCGQTPDGRKELVDYLGKENGRAVVYEGGSCGDTLQTEGKDASHGQQVPCKEGAAKKAVLYYEHLAGKNTPRGTVSLLKVQLQTGRFHQIRAQLSHAGHPILGDAKYGSAESRELSRRLGIRNTALCACRLTFVHPYTGKKMEYSVKPSNPAFGLLEE